MKNETILVWIAATMIVVGFLGFTFSVFTGDYDQAGQLGIVLIIGGCGVALVGVMLGLGTNQYARSISLLMDRADDLTVLIVENEAEARRVLELAGISQSVIDDVISFLKVRYDLDDGNATD